MRKALLLLLTLPLLGCPKKKTDVSDAATDAAPADAGDVEAAAPAGPEASNMGDIARFGDETKIDHEAAKIEAVVAIVRKSPPNGEQVTRLSHGTDVVKIAQHEKQFLITFANPKKADDRLMGWVTETSFKATTTGLKCKTDKDCGAKSVCVPHEAGTKCERECSATNTAACGANSDCTGSGANAEGRQVQWCVSTLPADAGAPKPAADAGAAKRDGGK
jgi:hypothetical protein